MFHNTFLTGFVWASILWLGAYYPARAVAKQLVIDFKKAWDYLSSTPSAPAPVAPAPAPAPVA